MKMPKHGWITLTQKVGQLQIYYRRILGLAGSTSRGYDFMYLYINDLMYVYINDLLYVLIYDLMYVLFNDLMYV